MYLASHYSRKEEIKAASLALKQLGVKITSTWIHEHSSPQSELNSGSRKNLHRNGKRDLKEIREAESCKYSGAAIRFDPPSIWAVIDPPMESWFAKGVAVLP